MRRRFFDIAFTPAVQAEQARQGSRNSYAAASAARGGGITDEGLSPLETSFIEARDSFYLASISETGWPYVQHRGGPAGFVRPLDGRTIGWPEYAGNRQYVTAGNTAADNRVALILMDYPRRRRLKLLGRLQTFGVDDRPDLASRLLVDGYKARVERFVVITVEAFDWNCPQHITPRFTMAEIEALVAPLYARIAELEARQHSDEPVPS